MRSFVLLVVFCLVQGLRGAPASSGPECYEKDAREWIETQVISFVGDQAALFKYEYGVESQMEDFAQVRGRIIEEILELAEPLYKAANQKELDALSWSAQEAVRSKYEDWTKRIEPTLQAVASKLEEKSITVDIFTSDLVRLGVRLFEDIERFAQTCLPKAK